MQRSPASTVEGKYEWKQKEKPKEIKLGKEFNDPMLKQRN